VIDAVSLVLEPRHPSQLYAALGEGLIPLLILSIVWLKPRKPGLICSLYLLIYSCFRVVDEMFRLPDAHLSDLSQLPLGLTRGQFLSLWLFLFGVGLMIWTQRRPTAKMGGLLVGAELPKTHKKKK
jgi:phosphatidylglycerol---prolipoprotein diacylglyceryl transferase